MNLRSLGSALATCVAATMLAACSPPAATAPAVEDEAQSAPQISPDSVAVVPVKVRPERRPAASADSAVPTQYRYVDEHGKVLLAARLEDIPERQRSTATPLQPPPARVQARAEADESHAIQNADVTIFSTRSCPYCRAAMAHFDKLGIYYVNRDVEADEEARAEYLELTGGRRGVPVIVVGDAWMQGWSQPEFERLLSMTQ